MQKHKNMRIKPLKNNDPVVSEFSRGRVYPHRETRGWEPRVKTTKTTTTNNINNIGGGFLGVPAQGSSSAPVPIPKTRSNPERAIQRALIAELAVLLPLGAVVLHVPNEDAGKSMLYGLSKIRDGILPGCPDLLIVHQGLAYWLEVKAPAGSLNDNQVKAHPRLRGAGTPVEVIYSVEDGLEACRAWGLVKTKGFTRAALGAEGRVG